MQSAESGSRSSALGPLNWALGLNAALVGAVLKFGAPLWLLVGAAVAFGVFVVLYVVVYVRCLFKAPDLLRSESFTLKKQLLDKVVLGDSVHGVRALVEAVADTDKAVALLPGEEATK